MEPLAEALAANDFEVHLFQRGDRVLTGFSEATSERVAEHLRERDVALYLESEVRELVGTGGGGGGGTRCLWLRRCSPRRCDSRSHD